MPNGKELLSILVDLVASQENVKIKYIIGEDWRRLEKKNDKRI